MASEVISLPDFVFPPTPCPSPVEVAPNPELERRPLVERVVHALAVQPYTRDDLLSKFRGEGLRDCDMRIFPLTLRKVGLLKRDGRFHLATWKGVNDFWSFYTIKEMQIVKEHRARQSSTKRKADCLPLVDFSPKSVEPVEPVAPVEPVVAVEPVQPIKPVQPVEPAKPIKRRHDYRDVPYEPIKRRRDYRDVPIEPIKRRRDYRAAVPQTPRSQPDASCDPSRRFVLRFSTWSSR